MSPEIPPKFRLQYTPIGWKFLQNTFNITSYLLQEGFNECPLLQVIQWSEVFVQVGIALAQLSLFKDGLAKSVPFFTT